MSRYLLIDIGAGTMDILYYDDATDWHYKAVVPSPARLLAAAIENKPGDLLVTGCEMGGSPVSGILKERAKTSTVVMSESAAATVHHNPEKVRGAGIQIVTDDEAERRGRDKEDEKISLADVDPERIERIICGIGVPFSFDCLVICAQDHGVPPTGVGHLDFRHNHFKAQLDAAPYPHTLLFESDSIPDYLTRLRAVAKSAQLLPTRDIYVMDSGMAAILGASMDVQCRGKDPVMVLDIATSHTVGAVMAENELYGFFEYHTHDMTPERLDTLLRDLADGKLSHGKILSEGGHGAYIRKAPGFHSISRILATGPKRRLVEPSDLPMTMGAPWGDNMMTGTVGLLEAVRRRKGLPPMRYV